MACVAPAAVVKRRHVFVSRGMKGKGLPSPPFHFPRRPVSRRRLSLGERALTRAASPPRELGVRFPFGSSLAPEVLSPPSPQDARSRPETCLHRSPGSPNRRTAPAACPLRPAGATLCGRAPASAWVSAAPTPVGRSDTQGAATPREATRLWPASFFFFFFPHSGLTSRGC